jgi:hypothetical protein
VTGAASRWGASRAVTTESPAPSIAATPRVAPAPMSPPTGCARWAGTATRSRDAFHPLRARRAIHPVSASTTTPAAAPGAVTPRCSAAPAARPLTATTTTRAPLTPA